MIHTGKPKPTIVNVRPTAQARNRLVGGADGVLLILQEAGNTETDRKRQQPARVGLKRIREVRERRGRCCGEGCKSPSSGRDQEGHVRQNQTSTLTQRKTPELVSQRSSSSTGKIQKGTARERSTHLGRGFRIVVRSSFDPGLPLDQLARLGPRDGRRPRVRQERGEDASRQESWTHREITRGQTESWEKGERVGWKGRGRVGGRGGGGLSGPARACENLNSLRRQSQTPP